MTQQQKGLNILIIYAVIMLLVFGKYLLFGLVIAWCLLFQ